MAPGYSVVIPAYNAEATIAAAIRSILEQTVPAEAIIVVDDGSTDGTVAAATAAGATVLQQANAGPGAATTRGLAAIQSEFLATLDADDLWLPHKLERQFVALAADLNLAGVFAQMASFRDDPTTADLASGRDGWSRSTMLIRTDIARQTGALIDPPSKIGDMIDWLARVREAGHALLMLPEVLALRRIRPGSLTYQRSAADNAGYLAAARAALLRRRARDSQ
ncbi:MAG: glycosyl transferase family 2 [Devosia sp.]|nr:glycosyl transferase family 2 [Devosia sp.]